LQPTHRGVAISRPVFQRAGRGNEITGKMKGFATFFSGTGKGRSLLRYGFLGRLYRRVGWTDTDKLGAANPQPNLDSTTDGHRCTRIWRRKKTDRLRRTSTLAGAGSTRTHPCQSVFIRG